MDNMSRLSKLRMIPESVMPLLENSSDPKVRDAIGSVTIRQLNNINIQAPTIGKEKLSQLVNISYGEGGQTSVTKEADLGQINIPADLPKEPPPEDVDEIPYHLRTSFTRSPLRSSLVPDNKDDSPASADTISIPVDETRSVVAATPDQVPLPTDNVEDIALIDKDEESQMQTDELESTVAAAAKEKKRKKVAQSHTHNLRSLKKNSSSQQVVKDWLSWKGGNRAVKDTPANMLKKLKKLDEQDISNADAIAAANAVQIPSSLTIEDDAPLATYARRRKQKSSPPSRASTPPPNPIPLPASSSSSSSPPPPPPPPPTNLIPRSLTPPPILPHPIQVPPPPPPTEITHPIALAAANMTAQTEPTGLTVDPEIMQIIRAKEAETAALIMKTYRERREGRKNIPYSSAGSERSIISHPHITYITDITEIEDEEAPAPANAIEGSSILPALTYLEPVVKTNINKRNKRKLEPTAADVDELIIPEKRSKQIRLKKSNQLPVTSSRRVTRSLSRLDKNTNPDHMINEIKLIETEEKKQVRKVKTKVNTKPKKMTTKTEKPKAKGKGKVKRPTTAKQKKKPAATVQAIIQEEEEDEEEEGINAKTRRTLKRQEEISKRENQRLLDAKFTAPRRKRLLNVTEYGHYK